jgi:predicted amidohydrolase YtcJ
MSQQRHRVPASVQHVRRIAASRRDDLDLTMLGGRCICQHIRRASSLLPADPLLSQKFNLETPVMTPRTVAAILTMALSTFTGCAAKPGESAVNGADAIYFGGDIITVNDAAPDAEALVVDDGKIVFVGAREAAMKHKGDGTALVDLNGRTLLPGFIEGHSHFINSITMASQANVYAAPFGPGSTKQGIVDALKKLRDERKIAKGEVIMAYGYDDSIYPDGGKLTAADLDVDFPDNPVIVQHVSLHGGVLNTAAFEKYGITAETPVPPGGVMVRKPGTNEPEGLLMEGSYLPIFAQLPKPSPEQLSQAFKDGQMIFARAGITTAQEGSTQRADIDLLLGAAKRGDLFIDVVAFPFIPEIDYALSKLPRDQWLNYNGRLKFGGIKITCDGSPQGRTAFFTTPYLQGGPGGEKDWKGEPTFPIPTLRKMVKRVYDEKLPLIIHGNGDAAIDVILDAHEMALGEKASGDHRTGIIHCQFVRKDQLDRIKRLNIFPSFYTEHTYFFGATHIANRGPGQASFISPLKSASAMGIRFANHTDFNVAPIDQLFVLWSSVNREMRDGGVLGEAERIDPLTGIKALTIWPAYWYREEASKGSLEVGKLADLVILDANPLKVQPRKIKDIKVVETVKEGKTIYRAQ